MFAFTLVGTFVGAGFATGQEMVSFFNLHNPLNPLYFIFSCFLIYFTCEKTKKISKSDNLSDLFYTIFGKRWGELMISLSLITLFICFGASASGMGALFFESFSLPYLAGAFFLVFLSFVVLKKGMKGINILNFILTPIIIISIIVFGISTIYLSDSLVGLSRGNFIASAFYSLLYAGYNIFPLISITLHERKQKKAGFLSAFIFTALCGTLLFYSLSMNLDTAYTSEVPFFSVIKTYLPGFAFYYSLIICMALLTTGASCLFGFITHIEKTKRIKPAILYLLSFLSVLIFISFGFSETVRIFYPISGVFGTLLIIRILTIPVI